MTVSSAYPINVALVQTLRRPEGPKSLINGDGDRVLPSKWLHEGFAPEKTVYPFITYQRFPTVPREYTWGSVMMLARYDVDVFSPNSVEANNLDALVAAVLDEAELSVAGQSTLICRRVADLSSQDTDDEGRKIYMVGGTYEVWTDQPLPEARRASFTANAVIV
jgi:Protein of unknown function (DUF3168)